MSDTGKAVFLSYASQDAEAALRLCSGLRAAGVEVWFDQNELVGGDAWDAKIRKQIAECALFVPVISANTQARLEGYFRLEWKIAAQRTHMMAEAKSFLVPIVIDATRDADAHVPAEFKAVQWTRLRPVGFGGQAPNDPVVEAFCARVKKLLGSAVAGVADPGLRRVDAPVHPAATRPATGTPRRRGLIPVIAGAVAVAGVALVLWHPWRAAAPPPPAAATAAAGSEASRLVAKAWEQMDKTEMARNELLLAEGYCRQAAALEEANPAVWAAWSAMNTWYYFHQFERVPARKEAARDYAQKALALDPKSYEARYAWAHFVVRTAWKTGEERPALPILRELLRERPDEPRALYALGFGLIADPANADEGFAALERLAEKHPWFAGRALNEVGWMALFHGRLGLAESAADRALKAQPYWNNLGLKATLAMRLHGDLELAQSTIDRLPPTVLQENWGISLAVMIADWRGDHARAVAILETVSRDWLENFFYFGPTSFLSGWMRLKANQVTAAGQDFRRALELIAGRLEKAPNDFPMLWCKAEALRLLGMREEADRTYRQLREVWPDTIVQVTFEPPERALDYVRQMLQRGYKIDDFPPGWFFTAASLRLDPIFENVRRAPGFPALLAEEERREQGLRAATPDRPAPATAAVAEKSVAVLAFANLSDDKANEYFSDGISEELSYVLGRIEGLKVVAGSSGAYFKGRDATPQEKGRMLGVNHLVEGSVARDGQDLRVIARVTSVQSGALLWTDRFTGPANKPWDLQEEIARKVAREFSLKLGATGRAGATINPEAHRLHLEARHFWGLRSFEGFDRAEACYRQALALEPDSALLHAGLADVTVMRGWYAETNGTPNVAEYNRARRASERAIKLDPELSDAYAAPTILAFSERNWPEAERLARKAIALAPNNAAAHDRLGDFGAWTGRLEVALEGYGEAARLDPLSIYIQRDLVHTLLHAQRYEEVIATTGRAKRVWPADTRLEMWRAWALYRTGREEEAVATLRARVTDLESEQLTDIIRAAAIFYLRTLGLKPEAEKLAERMLARLPPDNYLRGFVFAASGDLAAFLPTLPRSAPAAGNRLFWGPEFDAWRENRQFLDAVAQSPFAQEYTRGRETLKRTTAGKAGNP